MPTLLRIQNLRVSPLLKIHIHFCFIHSLFFQQFVYMQSNQIIMFPSSAELVMLGVGYHHAGLDLSDRKLIEKAFMLADLPVLCEMLYYYITCLQQYLSVDFFFFLRNTRQKPERQVSWAAS